MESIPQPLALFGAPPSIDLQQSFKSSVAPPALHFELVPAPAPKGAKGGAKKSKSAKTVVPRELSASGDDHFGTAEGEDGGGVKYHGRYQTNWDGGGKTQAKRVADGLEKHQAIPRSLISDATRNGSSHLLLSMAPNGKWIIQACGEPAKEVLRNVPQLAEEWIARGTPTPESLESRRVPNADARADYSMVRLPAGCTEVMPVRVEGRDVPHYADYYLSGYAPRASTINEDNTHAKEAVFPANIARGVPTYPTRVALPSIGGAPGAVLSQAFFDPQNAAHVEVRDRILKEQFDAAQAIDASYGPPGRGSRKVARSASSEEPSAAASPVPAPPAPKRGRKSTAVAPAAATAVVVAPQAAKTPQQLYVLHMTLRWYRASGRGIPIMQKLVSKKLDMHVYAASVDEE